MTDLPIFAVDEGNWSDELLAFGLVISMIPESCAVRY